MNIYEEKACRYFKEGYNCAQSVFAAFSGKMGIDEKTALRYASAFGGGMGRLREVCGAVSGMAMVLSFLYGYDNPCDDKAKKELNRKVQLLTDRFKEEYKTIICRELIGIPGNEKPSPTPTKRTEAFYKERPCLGFVVCAAGILSDFLEENNI